MHPVINNQIGSLKESATLFINQLALKLRSEGQNICHLGFGESPFPVPEPMRIALQENAGPLMPLKPCRSPATGRRIFMIST